MVELAIMGEWSIRRLQRVVYVCGISDYNRRREALNLLPIKKQG